MNGSLIVIPNELGSYITPNIITFTDKEILIGEAAKKLASLNPKNTIYNLKRLIGRKFTDDKEFQKEKNLYPYDIINKDGDIFIQVEIMGEKKIFSPEKISSMILLKLKAMAQTYLGINLEIAIFSAPKYFNDSQRESLKKIGIMSGFKVNSIINDPSLACIGYGLDKNNEERIILIFDLGGTSLSISVLYIEDGIFDYIYEYNEKI